LRVKNSAFVIWSSKTSGSERSHEGGRTHRNNQAGATARKGTKRSGRDPKVAESLQKGNQHSSFQEANLKSFLAGNSRGGGDVKLEGKREVGREGDLLNSDRANWEKRSKLSKGRRSVRWKRKGGEKGGKKASLSRQQASIRELREESTARLNLHPLEGKNAGAHGQGKKRSSKGQGGKAWRSREDPALGGKGGTLTRGL